MDKQALLTAQLLTQEICRQGKLDSIQDAEFKVFSQFGEDGILQYLTHHVGIHKALRTFVEFGVETYQEANTRLLVLQDNWRGLIMDGSEKNMRSVRASNLHWRHTLTAKTAFIDKDNINQLVTEEGIEGEIGLLSVDIDGNDFWVWQAMDCVNPIIVVAEYNSVFGADHALSVPYDPSFIRENAHYSHLYWGCSLGALSHLAAQKGYSLVGSNSAGNNAFFVRNDKLNGLKTLTAKEAYETSYFRESRDEKGALTFLPFEKRQELIKELPLINVETNQQVTLESLYNL